MAKQETEGYEGGRLEVKARQSVDLTSCYPASLPEGGARGEGVAPSPARRNLFELPAQPRARRLPLVVILFQGEERIVWKVLPTHAGWEHRHSCGRHVHQFATAMRTMSVRCPGCKKWVQAP